MIDLLRSTWNDSDTPARVIRIERLRGKLAARLGDGARIITAACHRRVYSRDLADIPRLIERALFRTTPLVVVQPRDARDIAHVLQLANEESIAVFPRGIASSAYGGPVPTTNGIVLDLSPLQKIDVPNWDDKTITVDAGARWGDVDDTLARDNLQLYTYPSNRLATVAGWIAGGGYGINAFKYGHASRHVAALELVTPQGEIRTVRDTDADFEKYFGTEGLMGVITRVTLRVRARARYTMPHLLHFGSDADAFAFVRQLAARDIAPASISFYDAHLLHLLTSPPTPQPPPPSPGASPASGGGGYGGGG